MSNDHFSGRECWACGERATVQPGGGWAPASPRAAAQKLAAPWTPVVSVLAATMPLRAIENLSLADQVFQQLAGEIMSSRYAAGTNLPAERKLVDTFGVNRHVVREALKRLEQIGLIKVSQGGGTRVLDFQRTAGLDLLALMAEHAHVGRDAMTHWLAVHEMRVAIAADAARLCALRGSPVIKEGLVEIASKMSEVGDGPAVFNLELRFWDRVLEGAGNIAYRLAFNSLQKGVLAPAIASLAQHWSIHEVKESGYRVPIAQALAKGDARTAESRTRESLRGVVRVIEEQLSRTAKAAPTASPRAKEPKPAPRKSRRK